MTHFTKSLFRAVLAATAVGVASSAQAGPSAEAARTRIERIAAGKVEAVAADYAKGATLHWVGGPLDGTYQDGQLSEVWTKFAKANGPLQVSVGTLAESANAKGATVSAHLVFTGKATIKVNYVLVYREGKLVNEIWQIDPSLIIPLNS